MNKLQRKHLIKIAYIISLLIIFFVIVSNCLELNRIYIIGDEFGYWANASYLAGLDWGSVAAVNSYYSFGYSILLVPLFFIKNPEIMYRVGVCLNALVLCGSFCLTYTCTRKMFDKINPYIAIGGALCTTLYTNNVFQAHTTQAETLLYFLVWLSIYCFIRVVEKDSIKNIAFLIGTLIYMYTVHMRSVGILMSGIVVLIVYLLVKNKVNVKKVFFIIITVGVLFIGATYLKNLIISLLYSNNPAVISNDYSGQVNNILSLISFEGVKTILKSFLGKMYYLGATTFLLFYWFLWFFTKKMKELYTAIREKNIICGMQFVNIFILLSVLSVFAISSVYMVTQSRIDMLIYGRYNEMVIGPIIIIGLYEFFQSKNRYYELCIFFVIQIVLTLFVYRTLAGMGVTNIYSNNIVGLASLVERSNMEITYENFEYIATIKAMVIAIVLCLVLEGKKLCKRIPQFLPYLVCCLLVGGIWLGLGNRWVERQIFAYQSDTRDNYMAELIKKAVDIGDGTIYYVTGYEEEKINLLEVDFLQFLLSTDKVEIVNNTEINGKIQENDIIVVNLDSNTKSIIEGRYTSVVASRNFGLFCEDLGKSGLKEAVKELHQYSIKIPLSEMKSANNIVQNKTVFKSNGSEDCLLYGPYMELFPGEYSIEFYLGCTGRGEESLGKLQVTASSGEIILKEKEIYKEDFRDGKARISMNFKTEENLDGVEFVCYTSEGTILEINSLILNKIE